MDDTVTHLYAKLIEHGHLDIGTFQIQKNGWVNRTWSVWHGAWSPRFEPKLLAKFYDAEEAIRYMLYLQDEMRKIQPPPPPPDKRPRPLLGEEIVP